MLVVDPLNLGSARIIALRAGRAAGRIHLETIGNISGVSVNITPLLRPSVL